MRTMTQTVTVMYRISDSPKVGDHAATGSVLTDGSAVR